MNNRIYNFHFLLQIYIIYIFFFFKIILMIKNCKSLYGIFYVSFMCIRTIYGLHIIHVYMYIEDIYVLHSCIKQYKYFKQNKNVGKYNL